MFRSTKLLKFRQFTIGLLVVSIILPHGLAAVAMAGEDQPKSKPGIEKGTIYDVRDLLGLVPDVRDLLKHATSEVSKTTLSVGDIRDFIALAREVKDLIKETPKSTKSVSVPDLTGLLTTVGPIYEMVKASPQSGEDKIGLAEVAATVALLREVRELTKSAKSGEKVIGADDLAMIAAGVAIAREVKDLFKSLPIDETKGIRIGGGGSVGLGGVSGTWGVEIKSTGTEKGSGPSISIISEVPYWRETIRQFRSSFDAVLKKESPSTGGEKALGVVDIRDFIALAREVKDLIKETPKSTKSVSVPDLTDLLTTVGPIYEMVKALPQSGEDKIGLAEVAATVALLRELSKSAKSGEKVIGADDLAMIAAGVAIAREVKDLFKSLPIDETKGIRIGGGGSVGLGGVSGTLGVEIKSTGIDPFIFPRETFDLVPGVRELLKHAPASEVRKATGGDKTAVSVGDIRDFIALAREVKDLIKETPKSKKSVSVPDLTGLLTTVGPIYEMVKASPQSGEEKIGLAEVAATVALIREVRELSKSAKSGEKVIGADDLAIIATGVAIAREVKDLFKSLPIDETKGISFGGGGGVGLGGVSGTFGVEIKSTDTKKGPLLELLDRSATKRVYGDSDRKDASSMKMPMSSSMSMPSSGHDGMTDLKGVPNREIVQEVRFRAAQAEKLDISKTIMSDLKARRIDIGGDIFGTEFSKSRLSRPENNAIRKAPFIVLQQKMNDAAKTVYGLDDRKDPWEVKNDLSDRQIDIRPEVKKDIPVYEGQLKNLRSVCCLVDKRSVTMLASGKYRVRLRGSYGNTEGMCPEEKFAKQPLLSFCTGFIVQDDIIASAGHCVTTQEKAENICVIFGYQVDDNNQIATDYLVLDADQVFFGKTLLDRKEDTSGADWGLIKIDRKIPERDKVTFFNGRIPDEHPVYVIGNPIGLPTKIAGNAKVTNNTFDDYFQANLDTYGGNSGSPVFSSKTHEVVGILVRGGQDFERLETGEGTSCKKTFFVGNETSGGESVTRASVVRKALDTVLAAAGSDPEMPGEETPMPRLLSDSQGKKKLSVSAR